MDEFHITKCPFFSSNKFYLKKIWSDISAYIYNCLPVSVCAVCFMLLCYYHLIRILYLNSLDNFYGQIIFRE